VSAWTWRARCAGLGLYLCLAGASGGCKPAAKEVSLLNVSYDPTRELYGEYNAAFARHASEPQLVTVAELGGWEALQPKHFAEGGLYDRMERRP
jgi:sulfate transport system substrate-binding protein